MWASRRALSPEQHDAWKTAKTTLDSPIGSAWSSQSDSEEEDVFVVARMMLGESGLSSSGLLENWGTTVVGLCWWNCFSMESPDSIVYLVMEILERSIRSIPLHRVSVETIFRL